MVRVLLVLSLVAVSTVASALDSRKKGDATRIASPDEAVQRAVSQVNKLYQGRVLSARPMRGDKGDLRVRVKFLSKDGVIRIMVVDPVKD
ncbi:MAG: hypothetical protein DWQ08_12905 [Proteobacteria bacterium]|nr:MAG: hypothetical protein DWQ08_12905 [Pseudomonadota bacterium]